MSPSPPPRGSKHARAASAVSHGSPKRHRDDVLARDTGVSGRRGRVNVTRDDAQSRTRKREDDDVDAATTTAAAGSDDESSGEHDDEGSATEDERPGVVQRAQGNEQTRSKEKDGQSSSLPHGSAQKQKKAARTDGLNSPSAHKRRIGPGKRDPFITSPVGTKAKGKRVVDDTEDHEIGDEWTDLNGLRWQMDENGDLRREAVMVEMRFKFPNMPKDSRHPDAKVKVPVLVERFLTEAQYEDAREKKLLSFQEEERERERHAAEEQKEREQEAHEAARRRRVVESGRDVLTPKRVRNVQALFETSPMRRPASPMQGALPYTVAQRSRSLSIPNSSRMSTSSPALTAMSLSSSSLASPRASEGHKRLSLGVSRDDGQRDGVGSSPPVRRLSLSLAGVPASASAPQAGPHSTPRARLSYRVPLVSPSSPAVGAAKNTAAHERTESGAGAVAAESSGKANHSPLASVVARRKREEGLVKILQEEADRRRRQQQR